MSNSVAERSAVGDSDRRAFGHYFSAPCQITMRCTQVADRTLPDGEFTCRDLGDRRRYFAEDMYDVTTQTLLTVAATRNRVSSSASRLSYGEAIDLLRLDGDFRSFSTSLSG